VREVALSTFGFLGSFAFVIGYPQGTLCHKGREFHKKMVMCFNRLCGGLPCMSKMISAMLSMLRLGKTTPRCSVQGKVPVPQLGPGLNMC